MSIALELNFCHQILSSFFNFVSQFYFKVEQLQLKANNIIIEPAKTYTKQEPITTTAYTNSHPSINSQQLNLNLSTKIKTFGDEEEEDEEDFFDGTILS